MFENCVNLGDFNVPFCDDNENHLFKKHLTNLSQFNNVIDSSNHTLDLVISNLDLNKCDNTLATRDLYHPSTISNFTLSYTLFSQCTPEFKVQSYHFEGGICPAVFKVFCDLN